MKLKKVLCLLLIAVLALAGLTFVACKEEETPPGEETGTYYCEDNGKEYLIILNDGNKFAFDVEGKNKSGTYKLDENGMLTLTFNKEIGQKEKEVLTANHFDTYIDLTYNGKQYRFLKKIMYTVSFEVGAGTRIENVQIINGKTVSRPDTPTLLGYFFMGWYADESYTTPFAFDTQRIYKDTTVYARWVVDDPTVPEYLVDFNINMDGENPESRQTIGGRLYDLPTLSRSGYEFKGWWVSMYDNPQKLSYMYEEGMVLNENTTLYAYWRPISTGSKLPETVIKLENNRISWEGIVGANNYSLIIQKIIDERSNLFDEIISVTTTSPFYSFDFSQYEAGDYRISVTAISPNPANNSIGTIYYKNKALARVSHFAVTEPSVLYFNNVEGATRYLISVDVGNEFLNIKDFDNGNNTIFDFSAFPMPENGIKFTVTAVAEGRASSSRTFVYNRVLSPISNIYINEETEVLSWDRVPNATNYILSISSGNSTSKHEYIDVGNVTTFSLKDHAAKDGGIIINIYPKTKGWNSPEATRFVYNKTKLASPREISIVGRTITWNQIPGATSYELIIDNRTYTSQINSYELPENIDITDSTIYSVNIRALGANPSLWSDEFVMRGNMSNLRYINSTAIWDFVIGAVGYEIYVNGQLQKEIEGGINQAQITLTAGGVNTISARAKFSDESYSSSISIQVYAHTVRFNTNGGEAISERYFATGDIVEIPEAVREGYEFAGWYLSLGQSYGAPYTDNKFLHSGDITLFAAWLAESYTVSLKFSDDTDAGQPTKVRFDEEFTFEVPTVDDGSIFVGWFSEPHGGGYQLTNSAGESYGKWNIASDTNVYAFFASVLTYLPEYDSGVQIGWTVKQGKHINQVETIVVPVSFQGLPITSIDARGFENCVKLKRIDLPNTVDWIGDSAFKGCTNLERIEVYADPNYYVADPVFSSENGVLFGKDKDTGEISIRCFPMARSGRYELPDFVTTIRNDIFAGSTGLSEIFIPKSVVNIEANAFQNCTGLKTVEFENGIGLTGIGNNVFAGCTSLISIKIPGTVTEIGNNAFTGCTSLKEIIFEEGNFIDGKVIELTIGAFAFQNCALEYLTLPAHLKSLGNSSFRDNINLRSVQFESSDKYTVSSLTTGTYVFANCTKLASITIPASVTSLGNYMFSGCSSLVNVKFEDGGLPLTIGGVTSNTATTSTYVFQNCTSLTSITLPARTTIIGNRAFAGCTKLENVIIESPKDGSLGQDLYIGTGNVAGTYETYVFMNTALTEITIPARAVYIGKYAFRDVTTLKTIIFEDHQDSKSLTIGEGAFYNCKLIESITIPNRINSLANVRIFYGCESLINLFVTEGHTTFKSINGVLFSSDGNTLVAFPKGRTGAYDVPYGTKTIGVDAFRDISALTSVTLPETLTTIDNGAFMNCNGLLTIKLPKGLTKIGNDAFRNCASLQSIHIPNTVTSIGNYAFAFASGSAATSLTSVTFEEGGTSSLTIGTYILYHARLVTELNIPNRVTSIGAYAFRYMTGLRKVVFEDGDKPLALSETYLFYDCSNLESVYIASRITSLGDYCFQNCINLKTVTFEKNSKLTEIGSYTFKGCSSLQSIIIPKKVSSIGTEAFRSCSSLTTFEFEDNESSIPSIASSLFVDCSSLKSFTIPEKVTSFVRGAFSGTTSLESLLVHENNESFASVDGVLFSKDLTKLVYFPLGKTGNNGIYEIPEGTVYIGDYSFNGHTRIKTLIVSDSVKEFQAYSFENCINLESVFFGENPKLETLNNHVFRGCKSLKNIILPDSLKVLKNQVFWECTSLEKINIPDEITSIEQYNFSACTNLKEVIFGEDSKLEKIATNAFSDCQSLTSFTLPSGVTSISDAFKNCQNLESINLEDCKITSIDANAFQNCYKLKYINIPYTVTTIKKAAFSNCYNLERVNFLTGKDEDGNVIYSNLTSIADGSSLNAGGAFYNCYKLEEINFNNTPNLQAIGNYTFVNCYSLKSIFIPQSVKNLGSGNNAYIFQNCSGLEEVIFETITDEEGNVVGPAIKQLGQYMFDKCVSLKEIELPDEITSILDRAFNGCTNLESVKLPSKLQTLGSYVFEGCKMLSEIVIPRSVTKIGSSAFNNCTSLEKITFEENGSLDELGSNVFTGTIIKEITFPKTLRVISSSSLFGGCRTIESINIEEGGEYFVSENGVLYSKDKTKIVAYPAAKPGEFVFPNTVTEIKNYAFQNAILTKVTISSGVSVISYAAFQNCELLEEVVFPIDSKTGKIDSQLKEISTLGFNNCLSLKEIYLPPSLEIIRDRAFSGCENLTKVDFGENSSLNTLEQGAFRYCEQLVDIVLPNSLITVGYSVFQDCKSLTTINLPDSIKSIGHSAFNNCISLTSIVLPADLTIIENNLFDNCISLTRVVMGGNITSIGNYAFKNCVSLATISIPGSVTSLGTAAFENCTNLKDIIIPNSLTTITSNPFIGCANLYSYGLAQGNTSFKVIDGVLFDSTGTTLISFPSGRTGTYTVPSSVKTIGSYAFASSSLTEVIIYSNVTSIGTYAFTNSKNLISVTLPNTITTISDYMFRGCTALESIILPSSVTTIDQYAFDGCVNLKDITLPESLKTINKYAFQNCKSLTSIYLPSTVTSIGSYAFAGSGIKSIIIPSGITYLNSGVFDGCEDLESVQILGNLSRFDNYCFRNCKSLSELTYPLNSLTIINGYAFEGCVSLKTFILTSKVTSIGSAAFRGWTAEQTIYVVGLSYPPSGWTTSSTPWNDGCDATFVWNAQL